MKILRLIFSKWSISVLAFLVQVAAVVLIILFAANYLIWFQILFLVVGIVVFFFIINRWQNTDYKIPWLFLVLTFPIFGTTFFLMFAQNRAKKKDVKFMLRAYEKAKPFLDQIGDPEGVKTVLGPTYQGIETYLEKTAYTFGHLNNDIKYYPVGELMWKDMLQALKGAKKYILMEYFIIDPGVMWDAIHEILVEKAKEGVTIHLLYDDVGTVGMLKTGYYKTLRKEGIDAHKFNPFRPIASNVYNNRDHRKIMVIDGEVGFTGGINLGDEYINENKRLGHWKDTGIRIKGSAVNSLISTFFFNFGLANRKEISYELYFNQKPKKYESKGYINFFGDGPTPAYTEAVGESNFINMLAVAKKTFYCTTPYLICDYRLMMAFRDAALRGVDVRIVVPHIPDKRLVFNLTRGSYKHLREAGVKIYEYTPGFVHAKMAAVDKKLAFVGTINMDFRSLTHHYECGAVMYDCECIKDINADFDEIFKISQYVDDSYKRSAGAKFVNVLFAPFRALF